MVRTDSWSVSLLVQVGQGTTCYISVNKSITTRVHYLDILDGESENCVSPLREASILSCLRAALKQIEGGERPLFHTRNFFVVGLIVFLLSETFSDS